MRVIAILATRLAAGRRARPSWAETGCREWPRGLPTPCWQLPGVRTSSQSRARSCRMRPAASGYARRH